jgi:bla regulator protein BlaR1
MILRWMVYAGTVALLLGLAALALERVVRQRGWPVRWLWAGTLAGSLLLPTLMASIPAPSLAHALATPVAPSAAGASGAVAWRMDPGAVVAGWGAGLDGWLLAGWAAASAAALLSLLVPALALRRRVRGWRWQTVDGVGVWVAPDAGPAVVGFLRSHVVLPEWMLERSAAERSMVLAHECEHLRAGDPRLILGALVLAATLPWNPAVLWQARRLRQAVEFDCDARVLGRGVDPRAYGRVLLEVTEHGGPHRLHVAALSESRSSLERRFRLMFTHRPRNWRMRAAGATALAAALIMAACSTTRPARDRSRREVELKVEMRGPSLETRVAAAPSAPSLGFEAPGRMLELAERLYPPALNAAGIGGTAVVNFAILPSGAVDASSVRVVGTRRPGETLRPELAAASVALVRQLEFVPGAQPVTTQTQVALTWVPS